MYHVFRQLFMCSSITHSVAHPMLFIARKNDINLFVIIHFRVPCHFRFRSAVDHAMLCSSMKMEVPGLADSLQQYLCGNSGIYAGDVLDTDPGWRALSRGRTGFQNALHKPLACQSCTTAFCLRKHSFLARSNSIYQTQLCRYHESCNRRCWA